MSLCEPVQTEGRTLPAGAIGTIVGVWVPGKAFEVEFDEPFRVIITLMRPQVSACQPLGQPRR